ncbi:hypothetical protein Taro_048224 [Colocasia esculenta]|uniref:FH2 domain-containing protein n=1 Tax=Colocasia esculenta TaxID=4460 RepID=A0A843X7R1_COLES|nr:hypothetical protein [Colocasia esculenta]
MRRFSEEMIETLFGYADKQKSAEKKKSAISEPSAQFVQILDPKKSQNLAILLRALNVTTEEVCDALMEGRHIFSLLKITKVLNQENFIASHVFFHLDKDNMGRKKYCLSSYKRILT